uniref:ATP synthase F0 subunit 6 n=1 Tax=Caliscelis shandongensis TaxID=2886254 RepID=UPI001E6AC895|nr:ATP synthase F0 subunit 6 [Caliscelis shandongensis]YP_011014879.1 ATP synthase F0 subunit 6 [Caliscelis rhabdocladis]UDL72114.1 ATP synthase F0 subunit 6 [Caliscelis shandongensis]WQB38573.1 ATP synthase F0 subunit 6 [Caliscelis rhabdocladis]
MSSLFSSFDPSTKIFQMNWMLMMMATMILPMNFWMKKSRWTLTKNMLEMKIISEFKMSTNQKEMILMSTSIFFMIMCLNLTGMFPYNFTPTSHISISMSMSIPMWMTMMIFGWTKFTNKMFAHLLPSGTPTMIMPMMIIIETTGNIIRPISLSVRLTANMIAGHLLMTLLGNMNEMKIIMMILPIQITLMMFESSISIIQAYVFSTLITLYSSEIPNNK